MDSIYDVFDALFYWLYNTGAEPLLAGISLILKFVFSPLGMFSPMIQIGVIGAVAAVFSIFLSARFRSKREKALRGAFREKLASLGNTSAVTDKPTEKIIRKGISQQADKIYEKLILDKFTELGISYFFPMFFFLIWVEYDIFSPQQLQTLTGSAFALVTDSGTQVSAAYLYTWFFNGFLFSFYLLKGGLRFLLNRGIFKKKLTTNGIVVE